MAAPPGSSGGPDTPTGQPGVLGNEIEITTESIRDLATTELTKVIKDVAVAKSKFLSIPGGWNESVCWAPIFGDTDEGRDLERAHRNALEVFVAAAELLEEQLLNMQSGLLEVLAAYEEIDANAEEVLRRYLTNFGAAIDTSDEILAGAAQVAAGQLRAAVGQVTHTITRSALGQAPASDETGGRAFENE